MRQRDSMTARDDVIAIYSAILIQAVKDYKSGLDRKGVMRFLNSDWGRSIMDVLKLDHDVVVNKLRNLKYD